MSQISLETESRFNIHLNRKSRFYLSFLNSQDWAIKAEEFFKIKLLFRFRSLTSIPKFNLFKVGPTTNSIISFVSFFPKRFHRFFWQSLNRNDNNMPQNSFKLNKLNLKFFAHWLIIKLLSQDLHQLIVSEKVISILSLPNILITVLVKFHCVNPCPRSMNTCVNKNSIKNFFLYICPENFMLSCLPRPTAHAKNEDMNESCYRTLFFLFFSSCWSRQLDVDAELVSRKQFSHPACERENWENCEFSQHMPRAYHAVTQCFHEIFLWFYFVVAWCSVVFVYRRTFHGILTNAFACRCFAFMLFAWKSLMLLML